MRALPEPFRAEAEAAASAVVIDPTSWDRTSVPPPEHLEVAAARRRRRRARCGSATRGAIGPRRTASCIRSVSWRRRRSGTWSPAPTRGSRTFRVSRVRSVEILDQQPVDRPEGFDLADDLEGDVETLDERREWFRRCGARGRRGRPVAARARSAPGLGRRREPPTDASRCGSGAGRRTPLASELASFGTAGRGRGSGRGREELARVGADLVRALRIRPPPSAVRRASDPRATCAPSASDPPHVVLLDPSSWDGTTMQGGTHRSAWDLPELPGHEQTIRRVRARRTANSFRSNGYGLHVTKGDCRRAAHICARSTTAAVPVCRPRNARLVRDGLPEPPSRCPRCP